MGLSCLSVKTVKNHERMELSWANNIYNTEFSVETRLEHGFAIEITYLCENNGFHFIFTIRAYKAFLGNIQCKLAN